MDDQPLDDQTELVALIQDAGWDVNRFELREYRPLNSDEVQAAEIELTVKMDYRDEGDDQNPYRVK